MVNESSHAGKTSTRATWDWEGKEHWAVVRPYNWGVEKACLQSCIRDGEIDATLFVEKAFSLLVEDSLESFTGVQLQGRNPDYVWRAAKAIGLLEHLRRIGARLINAPDADLLRRVVQENLIVELRLRRSGYTLEELEGMPAEHVAALYRVEESDRSEQLMAQAELLFRIIKQRTGIA